MTTTSARPLARCARSPRHRVLLGGAASLFAGAALVAGLPGVAGAVTPPPPPLPTGVEDLQPYVGQLGCDPVAKPGVLAFQSLLMSTYRDTGSLGIVRDCGIGGSSEHKEGRAFDWAVSVNNPNHVAEVKTVTDWLTAYSGRDFASNARRFGIMYMIWNHHIWKAYQPEAGWQDYTGPDPHTNHVHFSFGWNGAKRNTSWWSGRVAPLDYGPYSTERPPAPTPPPPPPGAPTRSDIDAKHDAMGGDGGILGPATGVEEAVLGGRYRPYANGAIYSSPSAGVHEVHGEVAARYLDMGGSRSPMGLPTSDEGAVPGGGRGNSFVDGQVLWSAPTGARAVYGLIGARYRALGASASVLGLPRGDEVDVPGGRAMDFVGGQVVWSGPTGAHEVYGIIDAKYGALGDAGGVMGLPTTGEVPIATGRVNVFQGGNIYWSGPTGAHEVHGEIKDAYVNAGGANLWGLPVTDELPETGGRSNAFTRGRVYWSGAYGAHLVRGFIGDRYVADGAVARYGLPMTDEYASPAGRTQEFQGAAIDFDPVTLAVTVRLR